MGTLGGLAGDQRAAVEHTREQMVIHITGTVVAQGFAESTKEWAAEKGVGKEHGLFYTAAQSAVDAAIEAIVALKDAEAKLEILSKALYDMGA